MIIIFLVWSAKINIAQNLTLARIASYYILLLHQISTIKITHFSVSVFQFVHCKSLSIVFRAPFVFDDYCYNIQIVSDRIREIIAEQLEEDFNMIQLLSSLILMGTNLSDFWIIFISIHTMHSYGASRRIRDFVLNLFIYEKSIFSGLSQGEDFTRI